MTSDRDVKDKVVLVTGAAAGLGAAIAEAFLKHGAKYVTIADVAAEQGAATAARLSAAYGAGRCGFVRCDVTDDASLRGTLEAARRGGGGALHLVFNNAGIMNDSPAVYKKMIAVNYTALVSSTLMAIEMWRADAGGAGGTVINVASEVAVKLHHTMPIYNGTKAAVLHFSNCIGMEPHYSRTKVRVMSLCPGITNTALFDNATSLPFDKATGNEMFADVSTFAQTPESVAEAAVEMFRRGEPASTWLATEGRPAQDITQEFRKAYAFGTYV